MFYGLLFRNMLLLFRRNRFALVALMLAVLPLFSSCLSEEDVLMDDQPPIIYNMLVTVRTDSEGRTYFRLDDQTTLEPVDWTDTLGKQTRALLYGILLVDEPSETCTRKVMIRNLIEVPSYGTEAVSDPEKAFSTENTPVIIYDDWITCCEDGYLTLHVSMLCTSSAGPGSFRLLCDRDDRRSFYLMREKDGSGTRSWRDFVIAFSLEEVLSGLEDPLDEIVLNNYSYYGFVSIPFPWTGK